jgi:imidazolonepropionase-like amidohydrolase
MRAIRARHAYDGESFLAAGATVLVEDGLIIGVESYGFQVPGDCLVTGYEGTLLPGLIDAHAHLVADSGDSALDRVAGYSAGEIEEVISRALRDQLLAGVTTVRDLGDRRFCVLDRRDRQQSTPATEPTIVASGPPVTSRSGHCHYLGGEVSGTEEIIGAVAERVERGADIIKVMASGGVNTPGTDVMRTQFTTGELQLIVDQAHAAGVPVTAHAHGTPAVEQAVAAGVDGIEHCSCVTDRGFGQVSDETVATLARSRIAVCPTIGVDTQLMKAPPPAVKAMMARMGVTAEQMLQARWDFVGRLHRAGVRLVSGVDAGIGPAKRHGVLPHAVCELVTAGLSVTEALATATSGAAQACGVSARKGRLARGYDADLLVVDGDLEIDVTALHRPRSVLLRSLPVSV